MLRELRIRGYAVIDDLRLELGPGLNVLTGETGAGKSIVVGALSLLLGERASAEVIREGEDRTLVEGLFDLSRVPEVNGILAEQGIEVEDGWLILRREVFREGRNRAWVNGSPATAGLIGRLGGHLVDLHGQHEHQALLRREAQLAILDVYGGTEQLASTVADAHATLRDVQKRAEDARRWASEVRERADLLAFRAREIESAGLGPGEEERASAEVRRLEHSEDLLELSATLHAAVYGDDEAVVDVLGRLARPMDELVRIDSAAAELRTLHTDALALLQEFGRRLSEYQNRVEHDPERLAELRARLDLIHRLKRKYGDSVEEVLAVGASARREIEAADRSDLDLKTLEREETEACADLERAAQRLSEQRRSTASRLEEAVSELLPELGMEGGVFEVGIEPLDHVRASGAERVEFRVSLNPGFPPASLSRVASGGEMSRVMLALKTALADADAVPCLVFDEIDSGVGGRVAHHVAARLSGVAARHQVFAITHLPQIASRADVHLQVEKVEERGRAAARVRRLDGAERVAELARMLGGDPGSEISRRHALELLSEELQRNPG